MSRILSASAAIAIGIALTPSVALATNVKHLRSPSENSRHSSTSTPDATSPRVAVLTIGAGYALPRRVAGGQVVTAPAGGAGDLPWSGWTADTAR